MSNPLPTWALKEVDSLIDLLQMGPRGSARDVLAASLQVAHLKGQMDGLRQMAEAATKATEAA